MTLRADQLEEQELLDAGAADLDGAQRVTFLLRQRFHYVYDAPVRDLDHRLVVIPRRRHGSAHRRAHRLSVSTPSASTTVVRDRTGNLQARIKVARVAASVVFDMTAVVERVGGAGDVPLSGSALSNPRYLRPTRLTVADDRIRSIAHSLATRDRLATAERLCAYVHGSIRYDHAATSVVTTAAEALDRGRGVCQDSAHILLALCRAVGIPARYVSGHLLGEGGTHAWTEVVIADRHAARAVAFDPCNGRRAGAGYLTVAVGRDYVDVAPTSGTYSGTANGALTATKRVGVIALQTA
jgi:transglutaminase-like putative cysteine protease